MIMGPVRAVVMTSGDAMASMREKYGRGVVGMPLGLRVVATAALCLPSAFWLATSLVTGPPWTALTLAIAVLFAMPPYMFLPSVWERTEESVRSDWRSRRLQKHLEVELGARELPARVDLDPDRSLPKRW